MNTRLTNILLIILLIFNVAYIGKWWMGRHKHHFNREEIKPDATAILHDKSKGEVYLVKTLGFDANQQQKLDSILKVHFIFQDKCMNAYIRNQTNLFNALRDGGDSASAMHYADSMGILKVEMEKELYSHLHSIKSICNSSQQKQFNGLIDTMSLEFVHHHDFHNSLRVIHDSQ